MGYYVTETRGGRQYDYPQRFRLEARAADFAAALKKVRPHGTYAVSPVYGRDNDAEHAADVEALAQAVERVRYGVYRVPSRSEPGTAHTVSMDPHGGLHCTCPAGMHGRVCSHIEAVERRRELEVDQHQGVYRETGVVVPDGMDDADVPAEIVADTRAMRDRAPRAGADSAYEVVGGKRRARLL